MAQRVLETEKMSELQLRQELRSRFPEIQGTTVVKIMKRFNNDTEKCIKALEQKSQMSLYGEPSDSNSHPNATSLDSNSNHNPVNNSNINNRHQQPGAVGNLTGVSQASFGMPRSQTQFQEVPVKHEITHVSTVQHTVGPPSVPPKPPATKSETFAQPAQTRPFLFIDPANQSDSHPHTAPVRPPDFAPFIESSRKTTDVPSIRCGPTNSGVGGSNVGSPETRRPVRVINIDSTSGGTVTTAPFVSPSAYNSGFKVVLSDGGGKCSVPASTSSGSSLGPNLYRYTGMYVMPQSWVPETEQQGVHSTSIYIDSMMNPRRTNVQETSSDPTVSAQPHYKPISQYVDSQEPGNFQRIRHPLTVSLASHATSPEPSEGQSVVSVAGLPYAGDYNPGYRNITGGNSVLMNFSGGKRLVQEVSPSPPNAVYPLSSGLNQLNISTSSGPVGSSISNILGMGPYTAVSPVPLPRSPKLQHQRSNGSSTSRSNSMDSEHGSTHHLSDLTCEPSYPSHQLSHHSRGIGSFTGMVGMPVLSPTSSQSSMSPEPAVRDREAIPGRSRSGSMQEEAAYSQALLHHQRQRMDKLTECIANKRHLLNQLREEVSFAEKSKIVKNSLRTTFPTADDIARLCESNRRLQTDIQMYLNEIDMYKNGQTPFSIIDPMAQQDFFKNMPTGPNDFRPQIQRQRTPPPPPPPRPPPVRPHALRVNSDDLSTAVPPPAPGHTQGGGSADSEEGERWACNACTFENHPALKKCEMCEMPRMMAGRDGTGTGMGLVGSVSMPQLHHLGGLQGIHSNLLHRGAGGEVCYCHNRNCQQKLNKL